MAYSTGVSSSVSDLMTALMSFATANGFTAGSTWANGSYTVVTLSKGGIHFVFQYKSDEIFLNTATSVLGSAGPLSQPGAASSNCVINRITGPHVGYHFFSDGTALHVAVEVATNAFTHFNFGFITKNGSWTGGAFVTGTYAGGLNSSQLGIRQPYNNYPFYTYGNVGSQNNTPASFGHMRSDVVSTNGLCTWGSNTISNAQNGVYNSAWADDMGRELVIVGPNASNGRTPIVPICVLQATSGVSGPYYQLGQVPNAGLINIASIDPKAIVNTDWMVFPIGQKGDLSSIYINSFNYAMAYKK